MTPHPNNNDIKTEFLIKDTFLIGIQAIRVCAQENHYIMIKNKLTQPNDGPRLFMKSVSTQTLPIPSTCVDLKKKINFLNQVSHIWFEFFFISCATMYTYMKVLKILFQEI